MRITIASLQEKRVALDLMTSEGWGGDPKSIFETVAIAIHGATPIWAKAKSVMPSTTRSAGERHAPSAVVGLAKRTQSAEVQKL